MITRKCLSITNFKIGGLGKNVQNSAIVDGVNRRASFFSKQTVVF